jgi:hypothetical protein
MQLSYKQEVEIAEEQAINVILNGNNYENIRKRMYYDLAVLGIGAVKNTFTYHFFTCTNLLYYILYYIFV